MNTHIRTMLAALAVAIFALTTTSAASANVFTAAPKAPAFAAGAASIQAADTLDFGSVFFDASGTNYQDNTVTIAPGQTVDFSYPVNGHEQQLAQRRLRRPGHVRHGAQPTSCVQTAAPAGFPILAAPPLPLATEPPGWAGSCTFNTPARTRSTATPTTRCGHGHRRWRRRRTTRRRSPPPATRG